VISELLVDGEDNGLMTTRLPDAYDATTRWQPP
jgi:hypothetical protein